MSGKKVLIVEDDVFLVKAYEAKLRKDGLELMVVNDGDQAMEAMGSFQPDLVLLDLVMPRKDGFAFLEEIKQHPEYKDVPILVSSNLGQKTDIDRVLAMGVAGYIVKTDLTIDELVDRIHGLLNKT